MNIYAFFARLLPTKSVDAIVSVLTNMALELAKAEEIQNDRIASIDAEIARLNDERSQAANEKAKATRIRENVEQITA